ncbi:MAG: hypothetical protein JWQ96_2501 [Segetibacter sp.]|nr:hypothetical protein [Segetibacter sp.]
MRYDICLLLILLIGVACKNKESKPIQAQAAAPVDTSRYFQVVDFVKSQINEVQKTPYYIYKLTVTNGKKDSVSINNQDLTVLAQPFLKADINASSIKPFYKEMIFHDQTTNSFTLNYTTANKDLEVHNIDVLLEDDGETVKRIFIRKFINYGDSSAIEQLSWKPNSSFQISRLVERPDNKETSYQTTVVWNEK